MNALKVIGVETKEGNIEEFELINETNDKCQIILDRGKHKQTFNYLMDCFRDYSTVDRNKLFLELRKVSRKC